MTRAAPTPSGRSARVRAAIHGAVGELMGEGAAKISFPLVAERAGVNPTTLYRRWPDVNALLEEVAVAALTGAGDSVPDTGSLAGDLQSWAELIAQDITRPERARYLRAMAAARTDIVAHCAVTETRYEQAAQVVARAAARGEATPTAHQILDHVIAPLYYRVLVALEVPAAYPSRLVRDVLAMIG